MNSPHFRRAEYVVSSIPQRMLISVFGKVVSKLSLDSRAVVKVAFSLAIVLSAFQASYVYADSPVIAAHSDVTASTTSSLGAIVTYTLPTVTDTEDDAALLTITPVCSPASGTQFATGTTHVQCDATDSNGNTAASTFFNVIVSDTTSPVITAPATQTFEATSTIMYPTLELATATDDVSATSSITISYSPLSFPVGTTTVTWTATDEAGNSTTTTSFVVITDSGAPVITFHADVTASATSTLGAYVTYVLPTATDLIEGARAVTCSPLSNTLFALGTTTVTCSSADSGGLTATSTFNVVVRDTVEPSIVAPSTQYFEATGTSTTPTLVPATATDDVSATSSIAISYSPLSFALGTTTVTWTATDEAGNGTTTTSFVVITDTTAPTITAPATQTFEATGTTTTPTLTSATSTDLADVSPVISYTPHTFGLGTTTVIWTSTDASGNSATTSSSVVIVDTGVPTISFHAAVTATATSSAGAFVTYTAPSASDVADGPLTATCSPLSNTLFAIGTTSVLCSTSDTSGNTATSTFNIIVVDGFPTISFHADVTAEATSTLGAFVTFANPAASDAVDGVLTTTCSPLSGTLFATGTTRIDCSVADSLGQTATSTFNVFVSDTLGPVISFQSDVTASATSTLGAYVMYTTPTGVDAVTGTSTVSCSPLSNTLFAIGTTSILCTSVDTDGHTATSTFNVVVRDTTAPVITVPATQTFDATGTSTTPTLTFATATDDVTATSSITISSNILSFALGTTTVTWTATDGAGNSTTGTSSVVIVPGASPISSSVTLTPELTTVTVSTTTSSLSTIDIPLSVSSASLNLSALAVVVGGESSVTPGAAIQVNMTTSNFGVISVSIPAGITITGSSTWNGVLTNTSVTNGIEVGSQTEFLSLSKAVRLLFTGQTGQAVGYYRNNVFIPINTTCTADTQAAADAQLQTDGDCRIIVGSNLVVWSKHLTFFTVFGDVTRPVITAPATQTYAATGNFTGPVLTSLATATDNVTAHPTISYSPSNFPIGTSEIVWTATDEAGNIATTTSLIVISLPATGNGSNSGSGSVATVFSPTISPQVVTMPVVTVAPTPVVTTPAVSPAIEEHNTPSDIDYSLPVPEVTTPPQRIIFSEPPARVATAALIEVPVVVWVNTVFSKAKEWLSRESTQVLPAAVGLVVTQKESTSTPIATVTIKATTTPAVVGGLVGDVVTTAKTWFKKWFRQVPKK